MGKQIKISLSLKLTVIIVLISTIIVVSLGYINIINQIEGEQDVLKLTSHNSAYNFAKSHSFVKELDGNLSKYYASNTTNKIQGFIKKLSDDEEMIIRIDVVQEDEGNF